MDPYLNSLAFKLLADMPEEASEPYQAQPPLWDKNLRHRVGSLLVTIGQRMQTGRLEMPGLFDDMGCPSLEDEMHPSR